MSRYLVGPDLGLLTDQRAGAYGPPPVHVSRRRRIRRALESARRWLLTLGGVR